MSLIKVTDVNFNYADKELFNSISFQINKEDHAVLVGRNGAGKTTIFDLLTKKLTPDSGNIEWSKNIKISYLDQHYKVSDNFTVREFLEDIFKDLFDKEKKMNLYYEKGSNIDDTNFEKYLSLASDINDELIRNNFYEIKEKINKVLVGLGVPTDYLDVILCKLSSGQRVKVYLAKMLLEEADLLLLDEPTNYLDAIHVNWLADYLVNYPQAYVVISHDNEFLSKIANVVFHLNNRKIDRYKGDYSYFLNQSEIRREQYEKDYAAQQKYIKQQELWVDAHIVRATSSRMAKSKRKALAKIDRIEKPVNDLTKVHIRFPYSGDIGKDILKVENLVIGYSKPLLNPISFELKQNEKIAIIGKNGIGKSTLIKTLLKIIPSLGGSFEFNNKVKINYFSQTELDDLSITPIEYIQKFHPEMNYFEVRSLLARSGIKADLCVRPLSKLSGGEEAKTRMSLLTLEKSNILILDEPTNHLDKLAKESLKEAIDIYDGVVILVSHEAEFYEDIVDFVLKLD